MEIVMAPEIFMAISWRFVVEYKETKHVSKMKMTPLAPSIPGLHVATLSK